MPNQLSNEKSPYLRQHAHNPVDWMPWGEAAFEKARREDKPIFLSIGYSTCHWCHVMAHESFEDIRTAEVLNQYFVPVKLDREERPDIDRIYMLFVQATTGSGGWPMSVWLTPELRPFFGGTYFPPDTRYGRPGFRDLLQHLAKAWQQDRSRIDESSASVIAQLESTASPGSSSQAPDAVLFQSAFWQFRRAFDARYGGFGAAPKFPRPAALIYLLRYFAREQSEEALDMVVKTLEAMADGGMHDHLGGGFHRYSVDERWFVPHFEKMLYDQAQLAVAYLEAFQITRRPEFASVCRGILDYVLRDLTSPDGAFYSAEDADSADPEDPRHHGEGAFYIWRCDQINALLGSDASEFCRKYGIEFDGNVENDPQGEFTGRNILFRTGRTPDTETLRRAREKLLAARSLRPRPHLDNKVLTAWNGLMISALARAGAVLDEERYLQAAQRAAVFFLTRMYQPDSGLLLRRFCDGEAAIPAFADDYAFLAVALLDLFEVSGEVRYLQTATELLGNGLSRFEDVENGGFFSTAQQAPDVLLRLKDDYDGAEPSANSAAVEALLRAAHLTGTQRFARAADHALTYFAPRLKAQPTMAPQLLVALSRTLQPAEQSVIRCQMLAGKPLQFLRQKQAEFRPYATVFGITDTAAHALIPVAPFLGSLARKGAYTLYDCLDFTCNLPQSFDD